MISVYTIEKKTEVYKLINLISLNWLKNLLKNKSYKVFSSKKKDKIS